MTMKKLAAVALVVATTGASVAAMAEDAHPFYVRGQIGAGRFYNHETKIGTTHDDTNINLDSSKVKLAGRVAAGYKVNETISTELGYTKFSNDTVNVKAANERLGKVATDAHAIDALVKASLPVTDNLAVFGGAGAAYYTTKQTATYTGFEGHVSKTNSAIRPEFTVGSSYKLNENIALDASYTQIIGKGSAKDLAGDVKKSKYMPDAQLLAVGVSYSF